MSIAIESARPARSSARFRYAAFALATVAVGLLVHRGTLPLPSRARDVAGDALWAAMVYWLAGVVAPGARVATRAAAAVGFAWLVEAGQLVRLPWLVALRATPIGHLVLGSDFDARDLASYALGVGAAVTVEAVYRTRGRAPRAVEAR